MKNTVSGVGHFKKPKKFWVAVSDILNDLPPWLIHVNKFYILRILRQNIPQLRKYKNVIVQKAKTSDLEAIADCAGKPINKIRFRFDNGDLCFIAIVAEKVVGYIWMVTSGKFVESVQGVTIKCNPGAVWLYDCFVLPEFRFRGLWLNLQYAVLEYLGDKSKEITACSIDYDNIGSIKTHLRFGYEITSQVVTFSFLGMAIRWHKGINTNQRKIRIGWWRNNLEIEV